jgi:hypothetical protein
MVVIGLVRVVRCLQLPVDMKNPDLARGRGLIGRSRVIRTLDPLLPKQVPNLRSPENRAFCFRKTPDNPLLFR